MPHVTDSRLCNNILPRRLTDRPNVHRVYANGHLFLVVHSVLVFFVVVLYRNSRCVTRVSSTSFESVRWSGWHSRVGFVLLVESCHTTGIILLSCGDTVV
jgi:hypothetical protein